MKELNDHGDLCSMRCGKANYHRKLKKTQKINKNYVAQDHDKDLDGDWESSTALH